MTKVRQIARAAAVLLVVVGFVLPPRADASLPRSDLRLAALIPHSAPLASNFPADVLTSSEGAGMVFCRNDPVNNFDPLGLCDRCGDPTKACMWAADTSSLGLLKQWGWNVQGRMEANRGAVYEAAKEGEISETDAFVYRNIQEWGINPIPALLSAGVLNTVDRIENPSKFLTDPLGTRQCGQDVLVFLDQNRRSIAAGITAPSTENATEALLSLERFVVIFCAAKSASGKSTGKSNCSIAERRIYLDRKFGRTGNLDHDINLRGYQDRIRSLDITTGHGKSVFYSGIENRLLAETFAKLTGRRTLEMTQGGQWLEQQPLRYLFTRSEVDQLWRSLSARYAERTTGMAHAFGRGSSVYPSATFTDVEMRILRGQGTTIRFHY